MKKTVKVTLLSLLVFPGVGHLVLKNYALATAFAASFAYLMIGLIKDIYEKTQEVMDRVVSGEVAMDAASISQALNDKDVLNNPNLSIISFILLLIWVFAAFDAYRIANKNK